LPFQATAVKELTEKIIYQLNLGLKTSSILFEAPTGSGKTFISSLVIQNLKEEIKELKGKKIIYVWLSVSLGGLERQSADKFKSYGLEGVHLYQGDTLPLKPGDLFCAGWSGLKTKVKDTGGGE